VEKSEKLCRLIAYRDALDVITRIEGKNSTADQLKIKYIKGMCYEGLSEKEKAIDTFQDIIIKNRNSPYARLANRRIYIAGSLAVNGEKLKNLALGNNDVIRDPVFDKILEQESKLVFPEGERNNALFQRELVKEESQNPVMNIQNMKIPDMLKRDEPGNSKETGGNRIRINTVDGDIFVGIKKEETAEYLTLETMVGTVKIPRNKIEKIIKIL